MQSHLLMTTLGINNFQHGLCCHYATTDANHDRLDGDIASLNPKCFSNIFIIEDRELAQDTL